MNIKSWIPFLAAPEEEVGTISNVLNGIDISTVKDGISENKMWITLALGAVIILLIHKRNNTAHSLYVDLKTALNHARLSFRTRIYKMAPPNVNLVLCVDESNSMRNNMRMDMVKRSIESVLKNAQQVVTRIINARFRTAIIGFNKNARVITPPTALIRNRTDIVETINREVTALEPNGGTDILQGLDKAVEQMNIMANADPRASNTLVILSDGDDQVQLDQAKRSRIHQSLINLAIRFFAIGIGRDHNKSMMQELAANGNQKCSGVYVDATDEKNISSAMNQSYHQTIPSYHNVRLTSTLEPGSWSWNGTPSVAGDRAGNSSCQIDVLPEGETNTLLEIHTNRDRSLDLNGIPFNLSYRDRRGKPHSETLRWRPRHVIDPTIIPQR